MRNKERAELLEGRVRGSSPRALRLVVWLHRRRLDCSLADDCSAAGSPPLELRAQQLVGRGTRRSLARSLRSVVTEAEKGYAIRWSAVPICRRAIVPWREGILGLADRLEQPAPVAACGVARVMVLLTDDASPLYDPAPKRSIGETIWWVADGLQPRPAHEEQERCPPHAWGCPKIMKIDPEHVAWTCGRCGAIAKTDDPAVRPA